MQSRLAKNGKPIGLVFVRQTADTAIARGASRCDRWLAMPPIVDKFRAAIHDRWLRQWPIVNHDRNAKRNNQIGISCWKFSPENKSLDFKIFGITTFNSYLYNSYYFQQQRKTASRLSICSNQSGFPEWLIPFYITASPFLYFISDRGWLILIPVTTLQLLKM